MKRRGLLYLLSGIACIVVETIPQTSFEFSRGNKTLTLISKAQVTCGDIQLEVFVLRKKKSELVAL